MAYTCKIRSSGKVDCYPNDSQQTAAFKGLQRMINACLDKHEKADMFNDYVVVDGIIGPVTAASAAGLVQILDSNYRNPAFPNLTPDADVIAANAEAITRWLGNKMAIRPKVYNVNPGMWLLSPLTTAVLNAVPPKKKNED